MTHTSVAIIGSGPAGLILSAILSHHGIDHIVLEKQSREHVLSRVRAGVLIPHTVKVLSAYGLAERLHLRGSLRNGFNIVYGDDNEIMIDLFRYTQQQLTVYGQSELQNDLYQAADEKGTVIFYEVDDVQLLDIDSNFPQIKYVHQGNEKKIQCDFIAACDGFYGVGRKTIARTTQRLFSKTYPFSWLSFLSLSPPLENITYAHHVNGFALSSARNAQLSRYYLQVPNHTNLDDWQNDRIWYELKKRYPAALAKQIVCGDIIEKAIVPIFALAFYPMQQARVFLVGDSAHILPPTGAKGLNLAVYDVAVLARALIAYYHRGDHELLSRYSEVALKQVTRALSSALFMTNLLHRFMNEDKKLRDQYSKLNLLQHSEIFQAACAKNYILA